MKITEQQRQELIQQIANNLTGSFISRSTPPKPTDIGGLLHHIIIDGEELFTLKECNCSTLSRNSNDLRSNLENFMCNFINNSYDKEQPINLINIGSDFAGITIILAKLYLKGYKTVNLSIVDKALYNESEHLEFWKTLFFDNLEINYVTDLIHGNRIDKDICNNWLFSACPYRLFMQSNIIVFAEDIGGGLHANLKTLNDFIAGIKQARIHNFALAQPPNAKQTYRESSAPIINAISTGIFEQKIFIVNAEESLASKEIVFNVKCTTLNICKINNTWEICDNTQLIATSSNNEYHHSTTDNEQKLVLPDNKSPFNRHQNTTSQPSLPLLFSDLATTSNHNFHEQLEADRKLAQQLQEEERQALARAKNLQEQADRIFALSL